MRSDKIKALCTLMGLALWAQAHAAPKPSQSWQEVASQASGERIELDRARIGRMPNGQTAAWSRLTLGFEIPDTVTGTRYTAIEALNSYDCSKREYFTLKRVYLSGGRSIREEKVTTPRAIEIRDGSFEEKLLAQVCKPRSVGQMQGIADLAAGLMTAPTEKPGVMPADMRSEAASKKAEVQKVADSKPAAAAPASDLAPRTRMIDLPKIDKSQVEDPYKGGKPPAKEAEVSAGTEARKPTPAPAAPPPPVNKPATAVAAPAEPAMPPGTLSRAEIERQLATFGPRKAKPKAAKPVEAKHEAKHIHWSYEGEGGPPNWAKLDEKNVACGNGERQSPIDIRDGIKVDLEPIKFNYGPAHFSIIDNGHTVQVNVGEGHSLRIMERTYQLIQFHFHRPSEERINGRSYDMVAHLVHKDDDNRLAVVAVLLERGAEHPLIQTLWNNLPLEQGTLVSPAESIDLAKLLPENRAYWTYMGSLTTPPCSEGVLWMVIKQPQQISQEQYSIFGRLYRNNARPVQPANGRLIKETR